MKRRDFLTAAACLPLIACERASAAPLPPGELIDIGMSLGHRLRDTGFPTPTETRRIPVLVIGGGIAGLSAGWKLQRAGFEDFVIAELGPQPGGNARYGENDVSAHPFGAHYLPLPTREATAVRELLADLGALQGDPRAVRPTYDERLLCHAPQERLYKDGVWQDGVIPKFGLSRAERDQTKRFLDRMSELKEARDSRGRRVFAIPTAFSSTDPNWRALDRITMRDWLLANGFDLPHLHWYINYACRDDYGTDYRETSAWAGLHYFASRNGEAANAPSDSVLTAPAGNGWMVKAMAGKLRAHLLPGAMAFRLSQGKHGVEADFWLAAENRAVRYVADQTIWCAPLFVLPHVAPDLPAAIARIAKTGSYAPWLVANLTLDAPPAHGAGASLAWDNVLYEGEGLGYVVATHQRLELRPAATVLTYYRALSGVPPQEARTTLMNSSREDWARSIFRELGRAHADLPDITRRLDVVRHGHAMIRPLPGVVTDASRATLTKGWDRLHFAHSDVSGLSLFEEANYHGVRAAEVALAKLGVRCATSLA